MASSHPYIFGLSEIDAQHKAIEALLATLQARIGRESRPGALLRLLDRLSIRLEAHFSVEEAVIGLLSMPGTASHFAAHAEILRLIGVCRCDIGAGRIRPAALAEVVGTIVELIHAHDIGFVDYVGVLRQVLVRPAVGKSAVVGRSGESSHHDHRRPCVVAPVRAGASAPVAVD